MLPTGAGHCKLKSRPAQRIVNHGAAGWWFPMRRSPVLSPLLPSCRGLAVAAAVAAGLAAQAAQASDFAQPWLDSERALVVDAYEYNPIDWQKLATDPR